MGLLDDAIREHLDLKRARGGDPADIERMEREALGPVRREPTIGSTRFEAGGEDLGRAPETGYPDDRDELLDPRYHDSTAPHPRREHAHHEHVDHAHVDPHLDHGYNDRLAAPAEEPEQPKRRFLRRSRATSPSDPTRPDPGFHEEPPVEPTGLLEHYEPIEHHDPLEQHEPPEQHGVGGEVVPSPAMPPQLQFDNPPKRPRFSAEPPPSDPDAAGGAADAAAEQSAAAPTPAEPQPAHADEPDVDEAQETTEFDVQKHIAETRFQPEPETRVQPGPDAPAEPDANGEEDVLEETPEFLQDTPEHDRLWFEQRPPRDFDFDG